MVNHELTDRFSRRHVGPSEAEREAMLAELGLGSLEDLVAETVPASIRRDRPLDLPPAESEAAYLARVRELAARNRVTKSCIGQGYYDTLMPSVILRNVLENPGWYTPYTPYQAEIAQGRLEALLNFQTMVCDLTGMAVANASLLDEATAAAEAMRMLHRLQNRGRGQGRNVFLVSDRCFPQTLAVLRGRAEPAGIELRIGPAAAFGFEPAVFGVLVQSPDDYGRLHELGGLIAAAHDAGALVAVATDLLSLALATPPGEWGADAVVGSAQRFGTPMSYGGPHAAFFATREAYVREVPGRIIGISTDARGRPAYRMALQTREQHIRRERAKSNICTAQALPANLAGFYAVYHGPDGIRAIASRIHRLTCLLHRELTRAGCDVDAGPWFDTLRVRVDDPAAVCARAEAAGVNLRRTPGHVGISLGESTTAADLAGLVALVAGTDAFDASVEGLDGNWPAGLVRTSPYLTHPVFSAHRSEAAMMRYLKSLERKDIGLDTAMIPLGSCTMKLNAATAMMPMTWPGFSDLHPFAPADQAAGYRRIREELEAALGEITGFPAVSLQPNSGAQGEYTGLMTIRAYHRDRGDAARTVALIPTSAHGTNPASAVMAGMEVVAVACDGAGNIDLDDLRAQADRHRDRLAALMVTYPSTHGVFEEGIREICAIVHDRGGLVYMDGANLNAQVGLTSPAAVGADVCHLNLHKTFAIPHGGGGPGAGPIAVSAALAPYLPGHPAAAVGGDQAIPAVSAAPWGSAGILLISHAYIRLLGPDGLAEATRHAILNANYVKARLERHYRVLFAGARGRVAHELILDLRDVKAAGITEIDVAKRLMDYGFHAPTVSWPVPGTMMIEPTESEPKAELDRFCDALIAIRAEIQAVLDGTLDPADNPLRNAPHTQDEVAGDRWTHPYSREQAAFPLPFVRHNKVWPAAARIDDLHGDRHLVCRRPAGEA